MGLSSPPRGGGGVVLHAVASEAQRVQLVSYYILKEPKNVCASNQSGSFGD